MSVLTDAKSPRWVANPPQQNQREDRFLDSLKIVKFEWSDLTEILSVPHAYPWDDEGKKENAKHIKCIEEWIQGKEDAWLMRFYALLGEACDNHGEYINMGDYCIVRVESNREHVLPKDAFFPPEHESVSMQDVQLVKPSVYSAGRSEAQKNLSVSFLKKIGVHVFDENAYIELILRRYDTDSNCDEICNDYYNDLRMVISYWKNNQSNVAMLKRYRFLIGTLGDDKPTWCSPENICLDTPYRETGLKVLSEIHSRHALWDGYIKKLAECEVDNFIEFLSDVGVMRQLTVKRPSLGTYENPHRNELRKDYHNGTKRRHTDTGIDEDYSIENIEKYLEKKTAQSSRLIWDALIRADRKAATAHYRPNQQCHIREAESQLVCILKTTSWIPDKSGAFRRPEDMTRNDLRNDFPYDDRNGLLTAIGFGMNAKKRSAEYSQRNLQAQALGFESAEDGEKWAQYAQVCREKNLSVDTLLAQRKPEPINKGPAFPNKPVANPDRRQERIGEQFFQAPEKKYEKRKRSVRTTTGAIDPIAWLREQYTNEVGQMICQICKEEMPFRKRNGEHFFEKKEVLSRKHLPKEHEAQYLALCPLCAAKYEEFVKSDDDVMAELKESIISAEGCEIPISLGDQKTSLRFVEKHYHDLTVIIDAME